MADGLNIVLSAKLDEVLSTKNLQSQLDKIAKNLELKLSNLGLDSNLTSVLRELTSSLSNIKSIVDQSNQVYMKQIDIVQKLDGSTQKIEQNFLKSGEIIQTVTNRIKEQDTAVQKEIDNARKLASEWENVGEKQKKATIQNGSGQATGTSTTYKSGSTTTTVNADADGYVTSVKEIENLKQAQQETQKFTQLQEQLRQKLVELQQVGLLSDSQISNFDKMINASQNLTQLKSAEQEYSRLLDIQKELQTVEYARYKTDQQEQQRIAQLQQENAELQRQAELFKQTAGNKLTSLTTSSLGKYVDQSSLANVQQMIADIGNSSSLDEFKQKTQQVSAEIGTLSAKAKEARSSINPFFSDLKTGLDKILKYTTAGSIVAGTFEFFKEGIQYVNDYNKQLTLISTTTGYNQQKVQELGKTYAETASQMGVLTEQFTEGAAEFYRQQLGDSETMKRLQVSTEFAKISGLDFNTAAQSLTAATNTMKEDITKVSDVFTLLGDSAATNSGEIAKAFQKLGGEAESLQVPFEQSAAAIAVIENNTREAPETVGTALKSIYARAESMKSKGYAADESGNVTDINQVSQALATVGITLTDAQGKFRSFGDVLNDLGTRWGSITQSQQKFISTTMAGVYQASNFQVLMQNYGQVIDLTNKAMNAAGTTSSKYSLYLQGNEAALNRFHDSVTKLWTDSFNSDGLKNVMNLLTGLIDILDKVVSTVGSGNAVIFGLATTFLFATEKGKTLITAFSGMVSNINVLKTAWANLTATQDVSNVSLQRTSTVQKEVAASTEALTVAEGEATVATKGFQLSLASLTSGTVIGLVITGLVYALSAFIGKAEEAKQAAEQYRQQQAQEADNLQKNGSQIQDLANQYTQLSQIKEKSTEQEQQYLQVQQQLGQLLPDTIDHLDAEGKAHLKNADAINKEIAAMRQAQIEKANQDKVTFQSDYKNTQQNIQKDQSNIAVWQKELSGQENALQNAPDKKRKDAIQANIDYFRNQIDAANADILNQSQKADQLIKTQVDGVLALSQGYDKVDDSTKNYLSDLEKALKGSDFDQSGNLNTNKQNQLDTAINIDQALQGDNVKQMNYQQKVDFMKQLADSANQAGLKVDWLNGLFQTYLNMTMQDGKVTYDFGSAAQNLEQQFASNVGTLSSLNDAIDKVNSGHKLSYGEIDALIKQFPDLKNGWVEQNGQMQLSITSLKNVRQSRLDEMNAAITAKENEIKAGKEALAQQLDLDYQTIESIKTVADAKAAAAKSADNLAPNAGNDMHASMVHQQLQDQAEAALKPIADAEQALQNLKDAQDTGYNFDSTADSASSSTQQLTKLEQAINDVTDSMETLQNQMQMYPQHSEQYRKGLQQEIDLLKQKNGLIQQQINNPTAGFSDLANLSSGTTTSTSPTSSSNVSASQLNAKLGGVFANQGQLFINAGSNNGIDPALIAAIAMHETGNGTSDLVRNQNNVGGITDGHGGFQSYSSLADGVESVAELLKSYAQQGLTTISQIQKKWAPVGADNDPNGLNQNWINGVSTFYSELAGNGNLFNANSTSSTASDTNKKVATDVQNAKKQQAQIDAQIFQYQKSIVDDMLGQYEDVSAKYQDYYKIAQSKMQDMHKGSVDYNSMLDSQYRSLNEQKYIAEQEIDYIDGTQFKDFPEYQKKVADLTAALSDYDNQIKQIKQEKLNGNLDVLNIASSDIDLSLKKLQTANQANQDKNVGFNSDYIDNLNQQIVLERQKQDILHQQNEDIKQSGLLTEDNMKLMQQNSSAWLDAQSQIEQMQKAEADAIVGQMKSAIQDMMKAEDERHQTVVKNIDAEAKAYEDQINLQLKQLSDQKASTDYNDQLTTEQKARQKIVDQINALSMDNSEDAKSKRADLQKQLADEDQKIAKMQSDREYQLRQENLQDQLQNYKNDTDAKKQAEDDKYNSTKNSLQNQLDDQQHWADVTKEIMNGDVADVKNQMQGLIDQLGTYATTSSDKVTGYINNIKSSINSLKQAADSLGGIATTSGNNGQASNSFASIQQQLQGYQQNWQSATDSATKNMWHTKAVELASQYGGIYNSSTGTYSWTDPSKLTTAQVQQIIGQLQSVWSIADPTDQQKLHDIAYQLGSTHGGQYNPSTGTWAFPSSIAKAANGAELPMWGSDGKAMIVHEGEIVQTKDTAKDIKTVAQSAKDFKSIAAKFGNLNISDLANKINLDAMKQSMLPTVPTPNMSGVMSMVNNINNKEGDTHIHLENVTFQGVQDVEDGADRLTSRLASQYRKFGGQFRR